MSATHKADEVVWRDHPSWRGMIPWYLKWVAAALVVSLVLYGAKAAGVISGFLFFVGALAAFGAVLGVGHLKRTTTIYTITRSRVMEEWGILNKRREQARLEKITNITARRDLWERVLGIGRINIDTANDREDILDWWGVRNPLAVEALIDELRLEAEGRE